MREFSIDENLQKTLERLFKKDKKAHETLMKKIEEVISCKDVNHYKNLRRPLQHLKRVHIIGPFVLTFRYMQSEDKIIFYDFDHHDRVYKNR